ncbi:hypothetical protein DMB44_03770 [Thermoplasma sp. Kam2015]|nr:hypothetical protein DMB44_03770 [Thermoplasma sp. Kam2015]
MQKESIIFNMGIKEYHLSYTEVVKDLYGRDIRKPLQFIIDGIPKLDENIIKIFQELIFNYARYMHQGTLNQMLVNMINKR